MSRLENVEIEAINLGEMVALSSHGIGRVTLLLDDEGDETEVVEEAVVAVVEWEAGGWSSIPLDIFDWSDDSARCRPQ